MTQGRDCVPHVLLAIMAPLPGSGSPHAHFLAFPLPDSSSCEDRSCQNRQTCNYIRPGRYICTCSPGYYGSNCQYGACGCASTSLAWELQSGALGRNGQMAERGCVSLSTAGAWHVQSSCDAARREQLPAGLFDCAGTSSRIPRTEKIPAPNWSSPDQAPHSPQVGLAWLVPVSPTRARTQAAVWRLSRATSVSARRATLARTVETVSTN